MLDVSPLASFLDLRSLEPAPGQGPRIRWAGMPTSLALFGCLLCVGHTRLTQLYGVTLYANTVPTLCMRKPRLGEVKELLPVVI